ncbi:MAG: Gfo/Idh/MocA family oxidoreductase [candidate division Zixibacteria bacterium]|nr:Gfo/Idh/MocA family oxidoreductase [candidate division Zixibacteria bacterium]
MSTYRVGIIGCGSIAQLHMHGYAGDDRFEVVALSDPVAEALNVFGDRYEIANRYTDAREMLDQEALDVVNVCTWHKLHAPMTIAACARKPKAVLCEKPMATNMGECDEMMTVAHRNKVKLAIAHQRRFNPVWTDARNLIAAGAIGAPKHVMTSGSQGLLNDCSHLLDFTRYVMGDPNAVWVLGNIERKTDRYERDMRIEDRSAGIVGYDNGAVGVLLQEMVPQRRQGGTVYGEDGIMDIDEQRVRLLNSRTGTWEERPHTGEDASIGQARELADWIEGRVEHRGEASHGRAAVEIIMAIYESARMHEVVQMPVRTRISPIDVMVEMGDLPVERPGRYDIRAFLLRGEQMRPEGS